MGSLRPGHSHSKVEDTMRVNNENLHHNILYKTYIYVILNVEKHSGHQSNLTLSLPIFF